MIKCPKCGHMNKEGSLKCKNCGSSLIMEQGNALGNFRNKTNNLSSETIFGIGLIIIIILCFSLTSFATSISSTGNNQANVTTTMIDLSENPSAETHTVISDGSNPLFLFVNNVFINGIFFNGVFFNSNNYGPSQISTHISNNIINRYSHSINNHYKIINNNNNNNNNTDDNNTDDNNTNKNTTDNFSTNNSDNDTDKDPIQAQLDAGHFVPLNTSDIQRLKQSGSSDEVEEAIINFYISTYGQNTYQLNKVAIDSYAKREASTVEADSDNEDDSDSSNSNSDTSSSSTHPSSSDTRDSEDSSDSGDDEE